uniref:Uncharacterized protein n=1 Tax=Rhipicephalus zambeziensis TaxID=60191 RepID=A0A224YLH9_9ACAR
MHILLAVFECEINFFTCSHLSTSHARQRTFVQKHASKSHTHSSTLPSLSTRMLAHAVVMEARASDAASCLFHSSICFREFFLSAL